MESTATRRSVMLSGTVAQLSKAFNVTLDQWEHTGGKYRGRTGAVQIPSHLEGIVTGVFGLDNRAFAKPHFRRLKREANAGQFHGYTPTEVAKFYNFPIGVDGTGQVIGVVELGGGYRPADLTAYFQQIGVPVPSVTAVSVDRGRNAPSSGQSLDGEVMLDIEVAASVAVSATSFPCRPIRTALGFPETFSTGKMGRGLPDVSGDGDPASGYLVRVDGQEFPIGGTSAVAPLWAGLIALVNQKLQRRVGFINPLLYANSSAMRDVTVGDNKVGDRKIGYSAGTGWDPCTGLGSPDGVKLLVALGGSSPGAGTSMGSDGMSI